MTEHRAYDEIRSGSEDNKAPEVKLRFRLLQQKLFAVPWLHEWRFCPRRSKFEECVRAKLDHSFYQIHQ
jgi:hypothetical protein